MKTMVNWGAGVLILALIGGCGSSGNGDTDAGTDAGIDAGVDGGGDSGPVHQPGYPGSECWSDADCLFDGDCLTAPNGFPGGYCIVPDCEAGSCPEGSVCFEFLSGDTGCLPACSQSSECRQNHGYVCDADDTCWPAPGMVPLGGPCGLNSQCTGEEHAICILQEGFLQGTCITNSCDPSCPEGSECREIIGDGTQSCVGLCESDGDCRTGYLCNIEPGSIWDHLCMPGCQLGDCPDPFACIETDLWSGHMCIDTTYLCGPDNPVGDCEAGFVCSDSRECVPFVCDDTILEPNQDDLEAQPLPEQDTPGMQICADDEDWFAFTPELSASIYQIGIDYNQASGNLSIRLLDNTLAQVESATLGPNDIIPGNSKTPLNNESFALLGDPGSLPYFVKVYSPSGAVNNYTLLSKRVDYQDGPVCPDLYSLEECRDMLIPFPSGQPLDEFVGEGIFFLHGLTGDDSTDFHSASARWGRRELIMLVRNAVHEVQLTFPETTPLAVGDVGLSDGSTPGGHPNTTHDDGRNVDIAYYILPEYQRQWGNAVYRQICCDAQFLFDWSCVITELEDPEYGTCVPGSENTHIVDIPRTALFLAKLATGNRMRAVGVEAKIGEELLAEFPKLLNDGLITQQEHDTALGKMKTTADDPSWLWHFHHIHLSLCYEDCETKSPGVLTIQD